VTTGRRRPAAAQSHLPPEDHLVSTRPAVPPRSDRRRAFTLIEMLVVMACIVILAALLLPALRSARRYMLDLKCVSNLKQLGSAMRLYETDFKRLPPNRNQLPWPGSTAPAWSGPTPAGWDGNRSKRADPTWLVYWRDSGNPYNLSNIQTTYVNDIIGGPDGNAVGPDGRHARGLLWPYYKSLETLLCPLDNTKGNGVFSYTMPAAAGMKQSSMSGNPADTPLLIQEDPRYRIGSNDGFYWDGRFASRPGDATPTAALAANNPAYSSSVDILNHNGLTGVVYLDGHGELRDYSTYQPPPGSFQNEFKLPSGFGSGGSPPWTNKPLVASQIWMYGMGINWGSFTTADYYDLSGFTSGVNVTSMMGPSF
jgi:prepilin-type N-terminal cleavage/methylation domain-containing protein